MYKNILLIEDEQFIAEMYADILKHEGFNVTVVGDGQKGLDEAQTGKYDLVLLDLMLPNVTGLEILSTLRDPIASPKFDRDNHHIIVLTNLSEDDMITREINDRAEGYFLKVNITPKKLSAIIKNMGENKDNQ